MKIGVLLSGCGMYDGSEPSETILALLALERAGAQAVCVAPDVDQMHVVDHRSGDEAEGERRSALAESARLVRGRVTSLEGFWGGDLQGLIIPGGYGAPKTLMTGFMRLDAPRQLLPPVAALLDGLSERGRPLAAISLGRSVLQAWLGREMVGDDLAMPATEVRIDAETRTLFTPGFLTATGLAEAARGIDELVVSLLRMASTGLHVVR